MSECLATSQGVSRSLPTSVGHNIDQGTTCNFSATGDLAPIDPLLQPLGDNGGSAWTFGLDPASVAIDRARPFHCTTADLDARDSHRPWSARCDIGAYEDVSL